MSEYAAEHVEEYGGDSDGPRNLSALNHWGKCGPAPCSMQDNWRNTVGNPTVPVGSRLVPVRICHLETKPGGDTQVRASRNRDSIKRDCRAKIPKCGPESASRCHQEYALDPMLAGLCIACNQSSAVACSLQYSSKGELNAIAKGFDNGDQPNPIMPL